MNEFVKCPFCGDDFSEWKPRITEIRSDRWNLAHYCETGDGFPGVTIDVYGKSRKEVIERWNRRAADVQEHIAI